MVLLIPSKRKFFSSLKDNFKLNSINVIDDDILEDITLDLFSFSSKNEAVLYIDWAEIGLKQRINQKFQNEYSMKHAFTNFFLSNGGLDKKQTNQIILFENWNQLIHCISLFFDNSEFKWAKRDPTINDIGTAYVISKSADDDLSMVTKLPIFNIPNDLYIKYDDVKKQQIEQQEQQIKQQPKELETDQLRAKQ